MSRKYIDLFCLETGFKFEDGEIGFGCQCLGIVNPKTNSYVSYLVHDRDFSKEIYRHDVAMGAAPDSAYHKGPYLAVLYDGSKGGYESALKDLNEWIEKIMAAHYELANYEETGSLAALLKGGTVTQVCLTGGVSYGKFVEIF